MTSFKKNLIMAGMLAGFIACSAYNELVLKGLDENIYLCDASLTEKDDKLDMKNAVEDIVSAMNDHKYFPQLDIIHPCHGAVFPEDIASPEIIWEDSCPDSQLWLIIVDFKNMKHAIYFLTDQNRWTPNRHIWDIIKANSTGKRAVITILGFKRGKTFEITAKDDITISTSQDKLGAPIFYLHMPLPFAYAQRHPELSMWFLGDVSSYDKPRVVMENLPICGNCHSFSRDGKIFGMDMDYREDKGAYALAPVKEHILLTEETFITWNDFRGSGKTKSMGLFSKISPDGKYVISTVKEQSFFALINELDFSQFFFPIRGHIAYYSRKEKKFFPLPGADDPNYVQTCPEWSPDGKFIVFSRAKVNKELIDVMGNKNCLEIGPNIRIEDLNKRYQIRFDLYRIPFNHGKGGVPEPLPGASNNGKSNYFPRYSPDGKWIVFTQCDSGLAIQPESKLHIIPAQGGVARKMRCNTDIMNSWHSWSPNSRWLVFTSKLRSPYTELFLTHIDEDGKDSPPVLLSRFNSGRYAALVPEFVNIQSGGLKEIKLVDFEMP